jgi:hypothetical protein
MIIIIGAGDNMPWTAKDFETTNNKWTAEDFIPKPQPAYEEQEPTETPVPISSKQWELMAEESGVDLYPTSQKQPEKPGFLNAAKTALTSNVNKLLQGLQGAQSVNLNIAKAGVDTALGKPVELVPDLTFRKYSENYPGGINDIQNPFIKNVAIGTGEVLTDPLTYVGGGILDDLAKAKKFIPGNAAYDIGKAGTQAQEVTRSLPMAEAQGRFNFKPDFYTDPFGVTAKQGDTLPLALPPAKIKDPNGLKLATEKEYDDLLGEYEAMQSNIYDEQLNHLKNSGFKGVEQGSLFRDAEGYVIGRNGRKSLNPKWYRDYFGEHGTPSQSALKDLAEKQLKEGYLDDWGGIPPNKLYSELSGQIEKTKQAKDNFINANKPFIAKSNIERPFAITPGELKPVKNVAESAPNPILKVETPKIKPPVNDTEQRISKLYENTLQKTDMLTEAEKRALNVEDFTYDVKANAETLRNARKRVESGIDNEINTLLQKEAFSSDDFVTSMEILRDKFLNEFRQTGNFSNASEWLKQVRKAGSTEAGRTVQAHQIYTRTPEGMLSAAQKAVDKFGTAPLNDKEAKTIVDAMDNYANETDPWTKQAELFKANEVIASKLKPTIVDKYRGLQRIAFLANFKTVISRNVLGNLILGAVENIKDIPGTAIDAGLSLFTGKRTTTLTPNRITAQLKGAGKGISDQIKDIRAGVDTAPTGGQVEATGMKVFNENHSTRFPKVNTALDRVGKTANAADKLVTTALKFGDRPFYEAAYADRITQLKKLGKVEKVTPEMETMAREYALERTFQNDTVASKFFSTIKTGAERIHPLLGLFVNTVMPFTKTPANILTKLLEYTPAGLGKAIYNLGSKGKNFNQKYFVDNISRALTGTGIAALGYTLASKGILTGKQDKDPEVAAMERLLGILPYSWKFGDKTYTYDWAQPVSAVLAAGADAYYGGQNKDTFSEQLTAGAEAAGNTFFNLSMLQSLSNLFNTYNPTGGLIKTIQSPTGLLTPSISSQTAKVLDPYVRDTKAENGLQKLKNTMQSKTPGLSKYLPQKLDAYGKPIEQFQGRGIGSKIAESYLSPGFLGENKGTAADKEIYRVYKQTGEKGIFPKLAPDSFMVKGEKVKLTPDESRAFQKNMGSKVEASLNKLLISPEYKNAKDDDIRAKQLRSKVDESYDKTKAEFLKAK